MELIHANNHFAAASQAGSVGRRLDDVQSEVGSNYDLPSTLHTDGVQPTPPTQENPFEGVFAVSESSVNKPSIYVVFSYNRGAHIIDELGVTDRPANDGRAFSAQAGTTPSTLGFDPYGHALSTQVVTSQPIGFAPSTQAVAAQQT